MPILDAALAFALTMLVLATAVTWILELLRRFSRARFELFGAMIKECEGGTIQEAIDAELKRLKNKVSTAVASLSGMSLDWGKIVPASERDELRELSTSDLIARIKASKYGSDLLEKLGEEADRIFDQIGARYEAIGRKFTASFRNDSRRWTTGIAIVLALALSIDSFEVMQTYLREPAARNAVIARLDATIASHEAAAAAKTGDDNKVDKEHLQLAFAATKAELAKLTEGTLPFGYSRSPFGRLGDTKTSLWDFLLWGAGVLLTGILAGLGGPFWFDAVSGLSRAAQSARALRLNKPADQPT